MKHIDKTPYKTGDAGYNRRSGKKTLAFVGVCILIVAILSIYSIFLLFKTKAL